MSFIVGKSQLLKHLSFGQQVRFVKKWYNWPGGKASGKITYYPRRDGQEEKEPLTPSKLLMIKRIVPSKGNLTTEKAVCIEIELGDKKGSICVVKNTPDINAKLWKIKHLIQVKPISSVPNPLEYNLSLAEAQASNESRKLDPITLRRHCRKQWLTGLDLTF